MKKPTVQAKDAERYYAEASEWDTDQTKRSKTSETRAWRIAYISWVITLLSVSANFLLFPLKQIEHSIIRVDPVTGITDVQRVLKDSKTSYSEETDKYWLRVYVRNREGYLYDEYTNQYRTVGLLSSTQEQKKWYEFYRPENPNSPVSQYSNRTKIRVKIRSVSFITKELANVRFTKIQEQANAPAIETYWIATIKFRYVNLATQENDREINPIGFQVAEYRVDPETAVVTEKVSQ